MYTYITSQNLDCGAPPPWGQVDQVYSWSSVKFCNSMFNGFCIGMGYV